MSQDETTIASAGVAAPSGRRVLLVVGEGHVSTHLLPDGVTLTIGRDEACEVSVDHPKISRRHAAFRGGPPLEVEDLGSTNGIRVAGRRLAGGAREAVHPGVSVRIGPLVAVVLDTPEETAAAGEAPLMAAIPILDPTPAGVPEVVKRIAQGAVSVHIAGETGSGKEVLARTLHELSGRTGEFVAVNCATLSENLLESELFGHERGAFSGANVAKPGLLEVAAGGTVLLDEIGELPASLQAKLLRVLETRQVYRVGGVKPVRIDARFVSATHRDLPREVAEGRFRRDLYFRVNGITLIVSPLRDRRDAIPALAEQLLAQAAATAERPPPRIGAAARTALVRHEWPGNVRELRTVMERALLIVAGDEVRPVDLLFDRLPEASGAGSREVENEEDAAARARLTAAATAHRGNVTTMAQSMGTSRSQIRRLAQRLGIDLERFRG